MLAPVDALSGIVDSAEEPLASIGYDLLQYARDWRSGDAKETQILRAAGTAYIRVLVPWLQFAIVEGVFGASLEDRQSSAGGVGESDAGEEFNRGLPSIVREWESWLGTTGM